MGIGKLLSVSTEGGEDMAALFSDEEGSGALFVIFFIILVALVVLASRYGWLGDGDSSGPTEAGMKALEELRYLVQKVEGQDAGAEPAAAEQCGQMRKLLRKAEREGVPSVTLAAMEAQVNAYCFSP